MTRWTDVYDSDAEEMLRLQDEVQALRTKVEAVRRVAAELEVYLAKGVSSRPLWAIRTNLRQALSDPKVPDDPETK